jgi:PII-like signaling protein
MTIPEEGFLLRIFVGESDRHGHHPLYEAMVLKAREQGMAGATVLRGVMGFGKHSVLHTAKILRLSEDLPMLIEIVDSREKVQGFLTQLDGNDHGRIGDVGTNKSSSAQWLICTLS